MSMLLPEKKGIPKTLVNFYHKVFPRADERYWRTYKSTVFNEIKAKNIQAEFIDLTFTKPYIKLKQ